MVGVHAPGGSFSFPPTCSPTCAATFNPWFGGGQGSCFAALGLSYSQTQQFAAFGALCGGGGAGGGGGGGMCPPPPPPCPGAVESRYVLVDQAMSWAQADQFCRSRYRSLASIHSGDENELAFAACEASTLLNPCIDRFVDADTCVGAEGCWIGMHQPRGTGLTNDEFVLFDNTGSCMVDHRISAEVYDIPLSHIRVQRVDGATHEWDIPDRTLRDLMLGPWHGFAGENDRFKLLAGDGDKHIDNSLYLFNDGDAANYDGAGCPMANPMPVDGHQTQDSCPGTPNGLISMAPPGDGRDGAPTGDLVADYGECNYRQDWGWVVQSMWVTPNAAVDGWVERFQWTDGSLVDYGDWYTGEPNSGGNEDEVEMRMACDGYACFHGKWNDVDGDTATGGFARPFLCETHGPKYTLVDQPMTWPAAQAFCRQNFDDLAAIHSDRDHEDAMNACQARSGANPCTDRFADADTCSGSQGCWIGLREPAGNGEYSWTDGSHLDYTNWFPNEPNGAGGNENEVELRMGCDGYACFTGRWNDNRGSYATGDNNDQTTAVEQPFLCQGNARGGGGGGH